MGLSACPACQRHHDPAGPCPFCAGDAHPAPIAAQLGGALMLAAATTLGCVGGSPPAPTPRLIDSVPAAAGSPSPTPTPATTYGMPPPRRRRRRDGA